MRRLLAVGGAMLWAVVLAGAVVGQESAPPTHKLLTDAELVWRDSAGLRPGAKLAVVSGNPSASAAFTIRLQLPAGYKAPPHWHQTEEHVTVLSGTFAMGMGEVYDEAQMKDLPAGGYAAMPAGMRHFGLAKTATVVQIHGVGPFTTTYVNPADDPRTNKQ